MKTILAALTGACLLAAPMALSATRALAQSHGGGGHGGGGHGGAGFHGGGLRGGGFRGGGFAGGFRGDGFSRGGARGFSDGGSRGRGFDHRDGRRDYRGDGFRDGRFDDDDLFAFGFGGFWGDPWFYGDPSFFGYLDYNYGYGPGYAYGPPLPLAGDDDWSSAPPISYQSAPTDPATASTPCGHWAWDATQAAYQWTVC